MFRFMRTLLAVSLACCIVSEAVCNEEPKTVTLLQFLVDYPVPKLSRKAKRCRREISSMIEEIPLIIFCGNDGRLVRLEHYVSENKKEAIPALIHIALLTTEEKFQTWSIVVLSDLGAPETISFFRALSRCNDERIRYQAARAFERIYPNDDRVVFDIMRCLRDESPFVRSGALYAADNVADQRLSNRITALLHDPDKDVRILAYKVWVKLQPSVSVEKFKELIAQAELPEQVAILRATHKVDRKGKAGEQLADTLFPMLASEDEDLGIEADTQLFLIRHDPIVRQRVDQELDESASPLWKSVRMLGYAGWRAESEGKLDKALTAYRVGLANYRKIENKKKLRVNFDEGATLAFRMIRVYQKQGKIQEAIKACEAMAEEFDAFAQVYARDYPVPGRNRVIKLPELQKSLLTELKSTPDPQ